MSLCAAASGTSAPHHPVQRKALCRGSGALYDRLSAAGALCSVIAISVARTPPTQQQRQWISKTPAALVAEGEVDVGEAQRGPAAAARRAASRRQRRGEGDTPTEAIDNGRGTTRRSPSESKKDATSPRARTWSIGPLPGISALNDESDSGLSGEGGERTRYSSRRDPNRSACTRATGAQERQIRTER